MIIKSPLTYPGAKNRAIPQIAPLIPSFEEYREPFIGGGSVYFYVRQTYKDKKYWINDLSPELYNFYKMTQSNVDDVISQTLQWRNQFKNNGHLNSGKELHRFLRQNITRFNDIELGAAYYTLNKIVFSGGTLACSFSPTNYNNKFTEDTILRLKEFAPLLKDTIITNLDYSKLVEAPGDNVFLFLDPPYFNVKWPNLYGKSGNLHENFDHYRFAEVMKKCKHKFLITYDDSNRVRQLFDWANIMEYEFTYTMRNVKIGKELFISNYDFPKSKQKTIEESWG